MTCPDSTRLRAMIDGSLPAADQEEITSHLDQCPPCQQALEETAAAGFQLPGDLAGIEADRPQHNSAYWRAVHSLSSSSEPIVDLMAVTSDGSNTPHGTKYDTDEELKLDFLQPSENPAALGRLENFDILAIVGRGGMGVVLRAFDACLQRTVAIKVLAPQLATNELAQKRFCREARSAASITHENVVAIHQVEIESKSGLPFLVMQLVDGHSLQDRLDRGGPMELRQILRIGYQTAAGLAAAHAQNLIHRDVKPANILLERGEERVKLTDFGLARAAEDVKLTQTGFVAGTPLYMAPEQASSVEIDARADLFSLGSVLYAMAAGKPPFEGSTPFVVLKSVTEAKPKRLRDVNPAIPDWFEAIVNKLLSKRPQDRYQTAQEVADMLLQASSMVEQRPDILTNKGQTNLCQVIHDSKKKKVRAGLGIIVVWSMLMGGLAGFWVGRSTAPMFPPHLVEIPETPIQPRAILNAQNGPVWSVRFSHKGSILASGLDDGYVKIWDALEGKLKYNFKAHLGPVWAVSLSADGKRLATAGEDGLVKVWMMGEESPRLLGQPLRHDQPVRSLKFNPEGNQLVTGTRQGRIYVWDAGNDLNPTGFTSIRDFVAHSGPVMSLAYTPDGKKFITGGSDRMIRIWDASTAGEILSITGHTGAVYGLAVSPDGTRVASGSWDRTARVWDIQKGEELAKLEGHTADVWSVDFSGDGKTLVTGSEDRTVRVWNLDDKKELAILKGHEATVYSVAVAGDGTIASGSRDGTIRLWNAVR